MNILLIMPNASIHRLKLGKVCLSFREAPLTLTTLAALVPPELKANIKIVDESVENIPFDEKFDLVGISCLTGTALRSYEIAKRFKSSGATTVLGGIHVTLRPDEAQKHADTIVIGFAEKTWPELLRDFKNGELKKFYKNEIIDLKNLPAPRRDLQKKWGYMSPNTVFATRGCRKSCEFCTVPAVPFGWHTRPVIEVIDEIRRITSNRVVFNDVSLVEDKEYAKELFSAMIPLKKKWGGLATISVASDPELLDLMSESGCIYLLIGFESFAKKGLEALNKQFNVMQEYAQAMKEFHNRNIIIQGCFIFGLDQDDKSVFKNTVEAVNDLKIDIPRFAIYTPYPKTKAFKRLKEEGRILHEQWAYYDTQHVVYLPSKMTPQELDEGFRWAYEQAFRVSSIAKRTAGSKYFPITFLGNLAYRMYVRRLQNDLERFYLSEKAGKEICYV